MSTEVIVLPAYNRYFPQAFSQSPSGIIAYGCRNIIYFVDARCYPPIILDSKCIHRAYKEKVAALSFCKCENIELIASISDCGEVKIWDINTGTTVNNYIVKEGIFNIEWLYGSPNTVVFPQDTKVLIKWNISTNNVSKIRFGSELKTCFITSNKQSPNLLAIGHNNGTITVLDIVQEKILHKLKDHTREINILTWSPVLPDILLSVGSDYSVRLWKMGEDRSTKLYWIGRAKPDDRKRIRVLGICHPKDADVLICSNTYGEIGEVSLLEEKPRFKPYSKINGEINCRCLFALFSGTLKVEEGMVDILYCFDNYMFSLWNISEKKLISFLPLFMGFIYDLAFSPVNPIYLSISNGDGILRIWNSQADSQISRMVSVFVQAKTKIMTAAWHPVWENLIAFGTDDGKLGLIDTIKKRSQYPFETLHRGKVYCVRWGPCKAASIEDAGIDEYFIYSCGGGEIYINKYKKLNEQALNFHEIATQPADLESIDNTCSEITWKSDFSCVCLGTYKGFIDVYDDKLVFLSRCNLEMKSIESLQWHPESTYMSPNGSPLKFWLACSGNDSNIYIVDTTKIFDEKKENSVDWIVKKLTGHKKHINATCWSPHMDELLVSASKDGSALVWNACTGNIIASYLGHSDVVNTVQWSVFDEDVIYSGGQDNCVRVWRISQQKSVAPADKAPSRKKLRKPKLLPKETEKLNDSEDEVTTGNENSTLEIKSTSVNNSEIAVEKDESTKTVGSENTDEVALAAHEKKKYTEKFNGENKHSQALWLSHTNKKSAPLFGLSFKSTTKDEDIKDCMQLADILSKQNQDIEESFNPLKPNEGIISDADSLKFGLFTDQTTALRMVEIQAGKCKSSGNISHYCQLSIMTNKVQTLITEAADNGTLSSYLVSLAPSVSYSFWLEICEKYALQLLQEQQPYVACTYFLMCNKIYEAVDVLKEKGKIIDALALAKLRLPESDPVISQLLHHMRKRCRDVLNPFGEVKCYLCGNDVLLAVKTLGSMPDASCIRAAAYICKKYQMNEEAEKYLFIFVQTCLVQCDWDSFKEFAEQESSLQVYSILFAVHEAFYLHLRELKKQSGIFVKEIFASSYSEEFVKFWNGNASYIDAEKSFMEYVCDVLESKKLLPLAEGSQETVIQSLDNFSSKWNALESSSEAHVAIAVYITKFILYSAMGNSAAANANFLKIFESSCNVFCLPKIVFKMFFPTKLLWNQNTKSIICQSRAQSLESNTNLVVSVYKNIFQVVTKKIMTELHPLDLNIISKDILQNYLGSATEQVANKLYAKELEEFLLAYFVSFIVNDLSKHLNKKEITIECHAKKMNSNLENKSDSNSCQDKTVEEVSPEKELIHPSNGMEGQKEQSELEALIEAAVKEADEKIKSLTNLQAGILPVNVSNNSFETKDVADSTETSANIENNHKEIIVKTDNKEGENISNGKCCVEMCPSEIISNVGNCTVDITSSADSPHTQCLASVDLFYHMILFIISHVCKEEFALLYYLRERLKCLHLARASLELSKFSKENNNTHSNKHALSSEKDSLGITKELKNKTVELITIIESDKSENEVQSAEVTSKETLQVGDSKSGHCSTKSINDNINTDEDNERQSGPPNSLESFNNVAILQENDESELSKFAMESAHQVLSNDQELKTISNDHNYSSPVKDLDSSQEILTSANNIYSNQTPSQISDQNALKELPDLIQLLDLREKGISYPNPLDIVSKVLEILYDVRKKSSCGFIQERLHSLIDDIVQWAEIFQISHYNFVCRICY